MIYKHNFSLRLEDLNKTMSFVLKDFTEKYNLETGGKYRIENIDGKHFEGYFHSLNITASIYTKKISIWCSFFKEKKDGSPSKVLTGIDISRVTDISLIPF